MQKYESGANRISASRLARIAAVLEVPIMAFYGLPARAVRERGFAYLRSAGAVRLSRAYRDISERKPKAALLALAEALARGR